MNTKIASVRQYLKSGFFKGVGIGAGLLTTSIFAAAAAMNVFTPGQVISSAMINQNFQIAAPEGAVMAFYLASCPEGWAPADGTNGTPDLRGMFIRGRDDVGTGAGGNDPDGSRAIGHVQGHAFQTHQHYRNTANALEHNISGAANGGHVFAGFSSFHGLTELTTGNPSNGTAASETRPRNVALTYCMRKN